MPKVKLTLQEGLYGFESINDNGAVVKMDTNPEMGGTDYGARPMQLLLNALAGCASIDVLSILRKQKQLITDFKVVVEGERAPNIEPSLWKDINITFEISGNIDEDKANKAIDLSMKKYCSVAKTLECAGAVITSKLILHNN